MSKYIEEQQEVGIEYAQNKGMVCGCCDPECSNITLDPYQINTLTKTLILNTLKEIQEVLGEEMKEELENDRGTKDGHNTLHRTITKKLLEMGLNEK